MLIGEYIHSIDDKNRLSFPVKFRKTMGKTVVVSRGLDNCLFVHTMKEWLAVAEKLASPSVLQSVLNTDARSFNRYLLGSAVEVSVDQNGRILLPEFLKEAAGLKGKVAIVGVYNRVELWDDTVWAQYKKGVETNVDALAERLGSIGVL